jgi:uroporphyrinogen-III synthase
MRVAVTRAPPENQKTADALRALGADPVLAPLLRIEPRTFDSDVADIQALLFTSAAGVRNFSAQAPRRDLPALTVGDATAAAARDAGFSDVRSADGDVHALAAFAAGMLQPVKGRLIHASGAHVAGDLVQALSSRGFQAERRIVYEAVAVTALPDSLRGQFDAILFHSARASEIYTVFGAATAPNMVAGCLSPAIAASLDQAGWKRIIVAPRPREDALLTALLAPTGASA